MPSLQVILIISLAVVAVIFVLIKIPLWLTLFKLRFYAKNSVSTESFDCAFFSNRTALLLSVKAASKSAIVLPATVNRKGHPYLLTGVAGLAFESCPEVKTIVLPDSVKHVFSNTGCDHDVTVFYQNEHCQFDQHAFSKNSRLVFGSDDR